jgi:paraquat-inducible protein B
MSASSSAKRKSRAATLGLFVVCALALLFVVVFFLAGGELLKRKQKVVMHFNGSIYGLQVGAPVVFRGVRLGSVSAIGVSYDRAHGTVVIPVTAELDREMLGNVSGGGKTDDPLRALPALVERGLRAQLALQSLLTGQRYVDLDFHRDKPAERINGDEAVTEIPTISTTLQDLQNQVGDLDIKRLMDDISAIAGSARKLISRPELDRVVQDLAGAVANLNSLSEKLNRQADPLLGSVRGLSDSTRQTMVEVGRAASQVGESAQRIGASVDSVASTLGPDAPLAKSLRTAAEELSLTAGALRQATANEAPLNQNLQRSLQDVAKAARALRELAETLDQQPESVLKGRR